jgi:hypothetical protein
MSNPRPTTESELVELVRSIDVPAPDALHRQVQALIDEQAEPRWRPARRSSGALAVRPAGGWRLGGALALAVVLVAALVVGLSGGGTSTLTVREAAALTERSATTGAPAENPRDRAQLAAAVDGIAFPYWEERFGWRSTGARSDRLSGRAVMTVFYANARGQRIGYAIVGGSASHSSGGVLAWRNGTPYRLLDENGSRTISWQRQGHLCVVSGRGVSAATLLRLASWDDRGVAA